MNPNEIDAEDVMFPSPYGEEVSVTPRLKPIPQEIDPFPSPYGEEVSVTPRFEALTLNSF